MTARPARRRAGRRFSHAHPRRTGRGGRRRADFGAPGPRFGARHPDFGNTLDRFGNALTAPMEDPTVTITELPRTPGRRPEPTPPAPADDPTDTPASAAPEPTSATDPDASAPADAASGTLRKSGRDTLMITLSVVAIVGSIAVGLIGFAMSYDTLRGVAEDDWEFGPDLAKWFPIGVDASILAFLALDLVLIRRGVPWPLLRFVAHAMTAATVWFNASAHGSLTEDTTRSAAHGLMPLLFVVGIEASRRLVVQAARLETGTAMDRVPLHRWLLAPWPTARLYRRMRLCGITSYPEMIQRDRDLMGYRQWLERKHGGDLTQADPDALLPMEMAKHGIPVDEALALPERQEQAAADRATARRRRLLALTTQQEIDAMRAQADQARAAGDLRVAQAEADGRAAEAESEADARATAAQRAAQRERDLEETAAMREADARRKVAEAEAKEAEARAAAAERQREQSARAAAEERSKKASHAAAEAQSLKDKQERLKAAAEADRQRAEAQEKAAEARLRAAEAETAAVEAEDAARLSPKERAVRRVARLIATEAGGDSEELPLARIREVLGVSSDGTASTYRTEAATYLATQAQEQAPYAA